MRKILSWLSKRFPEQRVVSLEDYNTLHERVFRIEGNYFELNTRLVALEAQVKRLNDQAGYVSSKKGSFALER